MLTLFKPEAKLPDAKIPYKWFQLKKCYTVQNKGGNVKCTPEG